MRKMQAKDIPDQAMIDLVDRLYNMPRLFTKMVYVGTEWGVIYSSSVLLSDICKVWDNVPPKVIRAKLQKLIERKLIDGCACGCVGGFTVIHQTDLPKFRIFDADRNEWIMSPTPRVNYQPRNRCHG